MTGSLAYRKHETAILRGEVPEKYTRLLPYIDGERIVELGSAEGVLACLLAKQGKKVTAIERQEERHLAALNLAAVWNVSGIKFIRGDIAGHPEWLEGADTLVAVRMIYYLRDALDGVFAEVAQRIPNVVLCGNGNRAARWRQGIREETKADNYYASHEGMRALLERHGYQVVAEETEGDPIVVGRK